MDSLIHPIYAGHNDKPELPKEQTYIELYLKQYNDKRIKELKAEAEDRRKTLKACRDSYIAMYV